MGCFFKNILIGLVTLFLLMSCTYETVSPVISAEIELKSSSLEEFRRVLFEVCNDEKWELEDKSQLDENGKGSIQYDITYNDENIISLFNYKDNKSFILAIYAKEGLTEKAEQNYLLIKNYLLNKLPNIIIKQQD